MPVDLQSYTTKNLDPYKLLVDLRNIVLLVNKLEVGQRESGDQLSFITRSLEAAAAEQGGSIAPGPPAPIGPFPSVIVDPNGAILGDGTALDPLRVSVDGVTIQIVGNQLTAIVSGASVFVDPAGALDGDGTALDPLAVRVDNTTIIINGSNQLEAVGGGGLYCEPLTDGDPTQPELIFAGGDVIMACFP